MQFVNVDVSYNYFSFYRYKLHLNVVNDTQSASLLVFKDKATSFLSIFAYDM